MDITIDCLIISSNVLKSRQPNKIAVNITKTKFTDKIITMLCLFNSEIIR